MLIIYIGLQLKCSAITSFKSFAHKYEKIDRKLLLRFIVTYIIQGLSLRLESESSAFTFHLKLNKYIHNLGSDLNIFLRPIKNKITKWQNYKIDIHTVYCINNLIYTKCCTMYLYRKEISSPWLQ